MRRDARALGEPAAALRTARRVPMTTPRGGVLSARADGVDEAEEPDGHVAWVGGAPFNCAAENGAPRATAHARRAWSAAQFCFHALYQRLCPCECLCVFFACGALSRI